MRKRELAEEAGVVLDEEPDVLDAVLDHGEAVEAHAESVAGKFGGIEGGVATAFVDRFEDSGVDHAATGDFDPLGSFSFDLKLHVDFEAWLGEGEEVWTEANFRIVAEHGAVEEFESAFEVGETDVIVDIETFELVEDREMGRVDFVAPISRAGSDNFDGRILLLHGAHLYAGSVRAEKLA